MVLPRDATVVREHSPDFAVLTITVRGSAILVALGKHLVPRLDAQTEIAVDGMPATVAEEVQSVRYPGSKELMVWMPDAGNGRDRFVCYAIYLTPSQRENGRKICTSFRLTPLGQ